MKKISIVLLIACSLLLLSCATTEDKPLNITGSENQNSISQEEAEQELLEEQVHQDVETLREEKQNLIAYNAELFCEGWNYGQEEIDVTLAGTRSYDKIAAKYGFTYEVAQALSTQATKDALFQEEVLNVAMSMCPEVFEAMMQMDFSTVN